MPSCVASAVAIWYIYEEGERNMYAVATEEGDLVSSLCSTEFTHFPRKYKYGVKKF